MIEITQNTAYKVWRIYCKQRYEKHYKGAAMEKMQEIQNFLHDLYVHGSSFDEAFNDNIEHFTETQTLEICSIYEQLEV